MKSTKEIQEFDLEVKCFLSFCFNNLLKTENTTPIYYLRPENFPGGFDVKGHRTKLDEDISVFNRKEDGSRNYVVKLKSSILVIHIQANGHHFGTEFTSTNKNVTDDSLECLYRIISYVHHVKSSYNLRNTYMIYNGKGYKLRPITSIGLDNDYSKLMEIVKSIS